ncbi:HD domain-containing protein [Clostridium hydrogenum]|uniref:HD domain-containing protein n=1 Tax=Clostridium hydrogenum TaxID=2855764 RepID=UPI001F2AC7E0|nr:HD domain-containing protein [Clostridium hydrogenum]
MERGIPSLEEANLLLEEARSLNPTPWVEHVKYVAMSAKLIAEQTSDMNPETAYILGLLHDIGRRTGTTSGMRHSIDGYDYLIEKGYDLAAQVCLSHVAFKKNNEVIVVGKWNGTQEQHDFIVEYLSRIEDTDYDKLIKLCDYIALPSGFCLMEKRLVDMAIRGGVNENTLPRWKSTMEIQKYFEGKIGKSIYSLLPGVVENTFKL